MRMVRALFLSLLVLVPLAAFALDRNSSTSISTVDTPSIVNSSIAAVTLAPANSDRRYWAVFNDSSAALYVKLGAGASSGDYWNKVAAGAFYESSDIIYTGLISGSWLSVNGKAYVSSGTYSQ